jgi:hypothetical protein
MNLKDTTFLRIEHYSGHPEVKAAADVLVNKYAEEESVSIHKGTYQAIQ